MSAINPVLYKEIDQAQRDLVCAAARLRALTGEDLPTEALLQGCAPVHQDSVMATGAVAGELRGLRGELVALRREVRELGRVPEAPVGDGTAADVLGVLARLGARPKERKAPMERVFRLLVLRGASQARVAEICHCSTGLVSRRVDQVERQTRKTIAQWRALARPGGGMEVPEIDPRAKRLYRRGLVDDTGDEGEDGQE